MGHFTARSLRPAVGHDSFYSIVAELDPAHAAEWLEMVAVQRDFQAGEERYFAATRAYSESMRLTLHWSLVFIFEDPALLRQAQASDGGLYGYFIRLHPTAFRANGATELSVAGMIAVTFNTRGSMINPRNIMWLGQGMRTRYEVAIRAANHVRQQRRNSGDTVTRDGYRDRSLDRATMTTQEHIYRFGPFASMRPAGIE